MKKILCYGDSNTWGYIPMRGSRYEKEDRYTGILQEKLGSSFQVLEEGINGRALGDELSSYGGDLLKKSIVGKKLKYLSIMLGTNDIVLKRTPTAYYIAGLLEDLLVKVQNYFEEEKKDTQIIIIAPVPVLIESEWPQFDEDDRQKEKVSRELGSHYQEVAKKFGCHFLDAGAYTRAVGKDGIHLTKEAHKAIGLALADLILGVESN